MTTALRQAVRRLYRADEAACVRRLLETGEAIDYDRPAALARARELVTAVRAQRRQHSGVDHLMHEFSLSSHEGVALMCLAEALLRIPDTATVDRLIRDKLSRGDWQAHLGHSPSLFVNAATWGLMLTGKLVATPAPDTLGGALSRLLAKGGEPLIRRGVDYAMRLLGEQFVMGEDIGAALARSRANEARGYRHSFDMLGEAALTAADAERYTAAYTAAIHAIGAASGGRGVEGGPGISVKLSALHPRYTRSQRARVMGELLPRLAGLCRLAAGYDIGLNIDAEEADRLELSLDLFAELAADPALAGWQGLGFVVQAYQKRAPAVLDELVDLARRHGRRLMLRLVKGAYWDSEIKRAQVDGLPDYPVFTRKAHSDLSYLVCAERLLAAADVIYPQFATHNAQTLATVEAMARARGVECYEFQCLHGMGEALYDHVVATGGRTCRIYAPVGTHATLLPYLVRRLLENGANSSFVNRLVDEAVSIEALVEEPQRAAAGDGAGRHPAIPLPGALFGAVRRNSAGLDLADERVIAVMQRRLRALSAVRWQAAPFVPGALGTLAPRPIRNPARHTDCVGEVVDSDPATVAQALANAEAAAGWHVVPAAQRAAALQRAADLLEAQRPELISLAIREAGKTWGNAVAEVREAVDFCRYYAARVAAADWVEAAEPPGPALCISPWNFPLAIFVGQVVAALAAGSPVLAKPAEQTPLIAALAVRLLHRAGIPGTVLQLLPGPGEMVGAALVADARVRSVVFTGSGAAARAITRRLAERPGVRLIAETGGINAMIVDSSALPEQVVQDVLVSGFDSAGQRCSALRILCLQEEVAERTLAMLRAAMAELRIGDPTELATDIGPVIDEDTRQRILDHIDTLRRCGRPVWQVPLPELAAAGCFVPPTLIGIESLDEVPQEVFGPVVHVLRFAGQDLETLLERINASGYGLTMGLHSRLDEALELVSRRAKVGNLYVNRNMVGAVVGVQPFGGEGLSGTGPKAGGVLYLPYLAGRAQVPPTLVAGHSDDGPGEAPATLGLLADWALASGRSALARRCADYGELSLCPIRCALPAPTGECNVLSFAPRGLLLCLGPAVDDWLEQAAAAFATGNRPAANENDLAGHLRALLPDELVTLVAWRAAGDFNALAGVLSAVDDARLRRHLAAADGPLLALHLPAPAGGGYPLYRLLAERVLSINTSAAGGNAALMSLVD